MQTDDTDIGKYHVKVISIRGCGEVISDIINITTVGIIDNEDPYFRIISVVPNPVSQDATIHFVLPKQGDATFTLIDMSGRELGILHSDFFDAGDHSISVSDKFRYMSSGTYFLILESQGRKAAIKITISR